MTSLTLFVLPPKTKVSAMLAEKHGHWARIIGIGTTPAEGLKQGVVVDIDKASRSVMRAVHEAEKMAGVSLRRYNVGVAGVTGVTTPRAGSGALAEFRCVAGPAVPLPTVIAVTPRLFPGLLLSFLLQPRHELPVQDSVVDDVAVAFLPADGLSGRGGRGRCIDRLAGDVPEVLAERRDLQPRTDDDPGPVQLGGAHAVCSACDRLRHHAGHRRLD